MKFIILASLALIVTHLGDIMIGAVIGCARMNKWVVKTEEERIMRMVIFPVMNKRRMMILVARMVILRATQR